LGAKLAYSHQGERCYKEKGILLHGRVLKIPHQY
jgi:hypothetical protein